MKDLFTIANETKMAGLNNTCVNRTDAYFVQFFTFNFEEGVIGNSGCFIKSVKRESNRFEPGMIFIRHSKIFMDLPLKFLKCKIILREREQGLFCIHD